MRTTYSNCLLATLYLGLRGKVRGVILVSSNSRWWPVHFVGVNRRGHIIHFRVTDDKVSPFWFKGRFEIYRLENARERLYRSGRRIYLVSKHYKVFLLLYFFLIAAL